MADFCRQCSFNIWGDENLTDFNNIQTEENTKNNLITHVLCEDCGPNCEVDHTGKCVSEFCLKQHGKENKKINQTMNQKYKVKLTYFKPTGKYYTEGEYETEKKWMFEISDEVRQMANTQTLPGINGNEWFILIQPEENHPNSYPCLIIPDEYRQLIIKYQINK